MFLNDCTKLLSGADTRWQNGGLSAKAKYLRKFYFGAIVLWVAVAGGTSASAAPFLDDFSIDSSANYTLEDSFGTGGSFNVSGGVLNITVGDGNTATVTTTSSVDFSVGESLGVDVAAGVATPESVFLTLGTATGQPGGANEGFRWRRDTSGANDDEMQIFAADAGIVLSGIVDPLDGDAATLWIDRLSTDTFEFQIQGIGASSRFSLGTYTYAALSGETNLYIGMQAFDSQGDVFPFDNLRIVSTTSIPEPSTAVLAMFAGISMIGLGRRRLV